jgi:hypothetical protein
MCEVFRLGVLIGYGLMVVALTTLPGNAAPVEWLNDLFVIADHPNLRDAIGHGALYGTLTAILYWALRGRVRFPYALSTALGAALTLALATELLQHFAPGRSVQLSDLLGNWLGIMTAAMLICFRQAAARPATHQHPLSPNVY